MSSLSEQERIGLEEVFLSISSSQNFVQKWSFGVKTSPLILIQKTLYPLDVSSTFEKMAKKWP
jgi:hypothetical protein